MNFENILITPFLQNTSGRLLLLKAKSQLYAMLHNSPIFKRKMFSLFVKLISFLNSICNFETPPVIKVRQTRLLAHAKQDPSIKIAH